MKRITVTFVITGSEAADAASAITEAASNEIYLADFNVDLQLDEVEEDV